LGTVLLLVGVLLGVQAWQTRDIPPHWPDTGALLQVVDAQGAVYNQTLAQWRAAHPGRAVAVHVWADWCPICRAEEGTITTLQGDWPVLTVAMQSGSAAQVAAVLQQRGLPWSAVVDPQGQLSRALGVGAVPAFGVLDAQGRLRLPTVGYTTSWGMRLRLWWVSTGI
jgi:thiol-disulfide isomerase/thioredoxin